MTGLSNELVKQTYMSLAGFYVYNCSAFFGGVGGGVVGGRLIEAVAKGLHCLIDFFLLP